MNTINKKHDTIFKLFSIIIIKTVDFWTVYILYSYNIIITILALVIQKLRCILILCVLLRPLVSVKGY